MASTAFNSFYSDLFNGNVKAGDTFKVMLVSGAYAPNKKTHSKRSHVTNEISGDGYTAGGLAVVPTVEVDPETDRISLVFPAIAWPNATLTAAYAVYFKSRGGQPSADELVGVNDFGGNVSATAGEFKVNASSVRIQN